MIDYLILYIKYNIGTNNLSIKTKTYQYVAECMCFIIENSSLI